MTGSDKFLDEEGRETSQVVGWREYAEGREGNRVVAMLLVCCAVPFFFFFFFLGFPCNG